MFNKSIKFLIHNKIVAFILLVLIIAGGLVTAPFQWGNNFLPNLPVAVDAIPDLGENQQVVFTEWPGKSPQDIEDQITYPLTASLLGIPGVKTVRSSSMFGYSSIYLIFEDDIEFYWSRSRILEKLNALPKGTLPEGANPSLGPDATALGQVFWYTLEGRDANGNTTGGWGLEELRSIQDFYVKYALSSAKGVTEVASVGGFVKEYQIDVNPELMKQYGISLQQIVLAVKKSNRDIGAQTLEINKAEYLVRGLGSVKSVSDIENIVVYSSKFTSVLLKDIAKIQLGPMSRRGILDKEGAEVVGGVVVARYGENPLQVITNVKEKIREISAGLPSKELKDGRNSQLTIVPFYDRSILIKETLHTLQEALSLEILITLLVIIIMVFNLRAAVLISGLLPIAVLMVFIAMKLFNVSANIVALSGIAIAIGTMVDMGVILSENIIRHLKHNKENDALAVIIYNATKEVSGAIFTAVLTTIVSFIPVFALTGAEGKLFGPLAFTKTASLVAALLVTFLMIPPLATIIFRKYNFNRQFDHTKTIFLVVSGIVCVFAGFAIGWVLVVLGLINGLKTLQKINRKQAHMFQTVMLVLTILGVLSFYWKPLGTISTLPLNFVFVSVLCAGVLGTFYAFHLYYATILKWILLNKHLFLIVPLLLLLAGFTIMRTTGKEFMPALNEGSFLLMPTSPPHAGVAQNKRVLQMLDMAVATIPEVETVVGKAGRVTSALDPAPLSMYENLIQYKTEFILNPEGNPQKFQVTKEGLFKLKENKYSLNPNLENNYNAKTANIPLVPFEEVSYKDLIPDKNGNYFRNWRPSIKSPDHIWQEIVKVAKIPGVTSAPKLQPIETRLVMLQTGMRAPMGIKINGTNLKQNEKFGLQLEALLKQVEGINATTVYAERTVAKPYLVIDINREKLARYGLHIEDVQQVLEVAVGGKTLSRTIEGRERYGIRIRYPRELRAFPEDIKNIYINRKNGVAIPLLELAQIGYQQGPQAIKSEDTFLTSYVLFDKLPGFAEVNVVQNAQRYIENSIKSGKLIVPDNISYKFSGNYENQLRSQKTLSWVIPLALLVIFLILYLQFRSVTTTLIVFAGIIVAFSGGFILIWLYGQDWFLNFNFLGNNLRELFQIKPVNLSVAVWVGFIALFGIATDDGVVMATYLTQVFKTNKPTTQNEIIQSVITAGKKRIRPCLMTTATTILALLPVLTSTGKGSDIMIPMAIPVFGGMLITLITLFMVPVLFSWKKEWELKHKSLPKK